MAFLDFLKKKPAVASSGQTAPATMQPAPVAPSMHSDAHLDLPELPSFDAPANMGPGSDLPPLPSFDDAAPANMGAPANFALPEMPTFSNNNTATPAVAEPAPMSAAPKKASKQDKFNAIVPPSFSIPETAPAPRTEYAVEHDMPAVDARTPYGPVFCDIETYRAILDNMNHAKDEVIQLQSFAENGLKLQQRTQEQYDAFHNSLSNMAKKLLLAEAKLFK